MAQAAQQSHPNVTTTYSAEPYKIFRAHQRAMNYFFRGSEAAAQLSRQFVGDHSPDTPIKSLLPETKEVKEICKRYFPFDKKANQKEPCPVLISDFLEDLHRIRPTVLEATITLHLSGFENFLRSWLWHATDPNLSELHASTKKQLELHQLHRMLSGVVKQPISLRYITERFPEV